MQFKVKQAQMIMDIVNAATNSSWGLPPKGHLSTITFPATFPKDDKDDEKSLMINHSKNGYYLIELV